MPNWKKVIVSGSDAVLSSLIATAGLTVSGSTIITGPHAQGFAVTASGIYSHAQGLSTIASGSYSHAEGVNTIASGSYSHAEGVGTIASGTNSHAEGYYTTASGQYSHAEGQSTIAKGDYSHAEGVNTIASGYCSHAEGSNTVASGSYQHVQGQFNLSSSAQSAFIVGNGFGEGSLRSNLIFAVGSEVQITGSVIATAGFTGSLQGTATMASQSGYTMQFVLATSASNPSPSTNFATTTYYMGAPVRHQLTPSTGLTRIYVPRPGKVKYAQLFIKTMETASAGISTFRLNKTDISAITLTETIANSALATRNYAATVVSTAISMSVVQGDWLEIAWVTPVWTTSPKSVEANAIIYIENNI